MFGRKPVGKPVGKGGSENVEVDESIDALERARHFGTSKISLQRLVFVNELVDSAHDIGYEATIQHLLPLVKKLADDTEVLVRQSLVGHFGDLAGFLIQSDPERGYQKVVDDILPIVSVLLTEKASEVRQAAADALTTLASHLRPSERGYQVLKTAISMSQNNEDEDARGTAVALLNGLAEALGRELCQQFVGIELVSLCEDPCFRVRKATAANFAEVSRVLGDDYVLRRLLPAFGGLVHDVHWGVRKAAAESLVSLAMALKVENRQEPFVPLMSSMLQDSSRWVRMSALQQLGYFIACLECRERVPLELLKQYVEIIEQTKANPDAADVSYHCAYTFAAVTQTMGAEAWTQRLGEAEDGSLQLAFSSLCRDKQLKTRKAMAASLHIVAQALGSEACEQDVLPHFDLLLQDVTPEVRAAALKNVANILRVLPGGAPHRQLLKSMQGATGKAENWRLRQLMASQISEVCVALAEAPGAEGPGSENKEGQDSAWAFVVPQFLQLCNDNVAEVRDEAARAIVSVMRAAAPELFADPGPGDGSSGSSGVTMPPLGPQTARLVRHLIRTFARGKTFRHRMEYIRMCDPIIRECHVDVFRDLFLRPLVRLTTDKVKNVRLCWAITLAPHLRKQGRLGQHPVLLGAARRLLEGGEKEVRRVLEAAPLGELPEGTTPLGDLLGPESDLDESDQGESWLGTEGGTGDSSECGSTDLGDDEERVAKVGGLPVGSEAGKAGFAPPARENVNPQRRPTPNPAANLEALEAFLNLPEPASSSSSTTAAVGGTLVLLPAPAAAPGAASAGESQAPALARPGGAAAPKPTSPGSAESRIPVRQAGGSPLLAAQAAPDQDRRPFFDPVEDDIAPQQSLERQQDSEFSSRRLLHEAEVEADQRPEAWEAPEGPVPQEEEDDEQAAVEAKAPPVAAKAAVKAQAPPVLQLDAFLAAEPAVEAEAPPVAAEAAVKSKAPPVAAEAVVEAKAPPVAAKAAVEAKAPPVAAEAAVEAKSPPVAAEAAVEAKAPPVAAEAAVEAQAPPVAAEAAVEAKAPPVAAEVAVEAQAPPVAAEAAVEAKAPPVAAEAVAEAKAPETAELGPEAAPEAEAPEATTEAPAAAATAPAAVAAAAESPAAAEGPPAAPEAAPAPAGETKPAAEQAPLAGLAVAGLIAAAVATGEEAGSSS